MSATATIIENERKEARHRPPFAARSRTERRLLAVLRRARRPLSAYHLLHRLEVAGGRKVAPPTVYRALEALLSLGLIARIESRSAYVICAHVGRANECAFFLCDRCHSSMEIEDRNLQILISERAKSLGFEVQHRVVEMVGLCGRCQETEPLSKAS